MNVRPAHTARVQPLKSHRSPLQSGVLAIRRPCAKDYELTEDRRTALALRYALSLPSDRHRLAGSVAREMA